jgi:hypothetical protein
VDENKPLIQKLYLIIIIYKEHIIKMRIVQYQQNRSVNFNNLLERVIKDFDNDILYATIFADALYKDLRQKRKIKIKRINQK